eukprot:7453620-Pyramimonas_sp.AAC.1
MTLLRGSSPASSGPCSPQTKISRMQILFRWEGRRSKVTDAWNFMVRKDRKLVTVIAAASYSQPV